MLRAFRVICPCTKRSCAVGLTSSPIMCQIQSRMASSDETAREEKLKESLKSLRPYGVDDAIRYIAKSAFGKESVNPELVKGAIYYGILLIILIIWAFRLNSFKEDPSKFHVAFEVADCEDSARYILLTVCYGDKYVASLRKEFEAARAADNLLLFSSFASSRYPEMFSGVKYSSTEALRIVGAAAGQCSNYELYKILRKGPRKRLSIPERIDDVVDTCLSINPSLLGLPDHSDV